MMISQTPMKNQPLPIVFDLTPENAFSPTLDATAKNKTSSDASPLQETESKHASLSRSSTVTEPLTYMPSSNSTKNWTSQIQTASISLRQTAQKIQMEYRTLSATTQTSNESLVRHTLKELTNTCVRMANDLQNLQEKQTSTDSLKTFAKSIVTASAGFLTAAAALNQNLSGRLTDQMDKCGETLAQLENKETPGSGDQQMSEKPPGSKTTCTVTRIIRSGTQDIPSTTTQTNKSSSTTTFLPSHVISSYLETLPTTQDPVRVTPGTISATFHPRLHSGQWSAQTNPLKKNLGTKLKNYKKP